MNEETKREIEVLEINIENQKSEAKRYPIQLAAMERKLDRIQRTIKLNEEMQEFILEGDLILPVEPQSKFQQDERFLPLRKRAQEIEHEAAIDGMKEEIVSVEGSIKGIKEEIARFASRLPELEAQLEEMKGE